MSYSPFFKPKDELPGLELPYLSKELMTKSVNSYVPRALKMNRIVFKYFKILTTTKFLNQCVRTKIYAHGNVKFEETKFSGITIHDCLHVLLKVFFFSYRTI